ncbi:MAG: GTPase ObgE [Thermodesulfobacteriota bacterium]|jgi:GTP-binding protein
MKFVDEVRIQVKAGDGGNGCVSFRRERFVPRGGPDGGDGGKGGDVILQGNAQLSTLLDLTYPQQLRAQRGVHGKGKDQTGRNGEDLIIRVPVGTLVRDDQTGEILQDLLFDGQRFIVAFGGRGGRGNARFATATQRAPRHAEKGEKGEQGWVRLELKLLADVGLIGYPNAGKSTLLSQISSAKPKIADYPFTTLVPNLGVVISEEHRPFVVADIPGLIEGASSGAGLGLTFLRHVERTRLLVHLLDVSKGPSCNPLNDFHALNHELTAYHPSLSLKIQILVLNKIDLPAVRERADGIEKEFERMGHRLYRISGKTGEGVERLMEGVSQALESILDESDAR